MSAVALQTAGRDLAIIAATVAGMEVGAWAAHKYIMHGFGWGWHRSHHHRGDGVLEKNDLYAAVFGTLAVGLFIAAPGPGHWLFWVGVGLTVYGVLYSLLHDGLVHGRFPVRGKPRQAYLQRLVQAHRMHHATSGRQGAVSFGFLYAPPVRRLAEQLRQRRAAQAGL